MFCTDTTNLDSFLTFESVNCFLVCWPEVSLMSVKFLFLDIYCLFNFNIQSCCKQQHQHFQLETVLNSQYELQMRHFSLNYHSHTVCVIYYSSSLRTSSLLSPVSVICILFTQVLLQCLAVTNGYLASESHLMFQHVFNRCSIKIYH